jgi:hypothetical protein
MTPIDSAAKHHLPPRLMPSVGDMRFGVTPHPTFTRGVGLLLDLLQGVQFRATSSFLVVDADRRRSADLFCSCSPSGCG